MEKKLNLHKSLYFYLFAGFAICIAIHCARITIPYRKESRSAALLKVVPGELRNKYSSQAIQKYEQAAQSNMSVASYVESNLGKQEQAIWQEIETQTGITRDEAYEVKEDCKKFYHDNHGKLGSISAKLSEKSIALAREAITDFNVDPKMIALEPGKNTLLCADTMTINEKEHLSVPHKAAKAIVGHEMIHYLLDDCFVLQALQLIMKDEGISFSKCGYSHPYYKLRRFQELRADILPMFKSHDYALASVDCLRILLKDYGDGGYISHPKTSFRLKEVKSIYDALCLEKALIQ